MDAALQLFHDKGFRNTCMEDIIKETSLSKGGFYHYFSSTDEILLAIMESETYIVFELFLQDLARENRESIIASLAQSMIDRIYRENQSKRLFIMFFFEMVYKPDFIERYLAIEDDTLGKIEEYGQANAQILFAIARDERMIFLSRLNTVLILFYHIFPAKQMMRRQMHYIHDLFLRILEDIVPEEV